LYLEVGGRLACAPSALFGRAFGAFWGRGPGAVARAGLASAPVFLPRVRREREDPRRERGWPLPSLPSVPSPAFGLIRLRTWGWQRPLPG